MNKSLANEQTKRCTDPVQKGVWKRFRYEVFDGILLIRKGKHLPMILAGVAGFEPAVEDTPLVGVKVRCLTSLAIPLYCAGSCSGVPPNQPVTDFQSRLWRVVKALPLTHNLMVSYLERRTRLELAPLCRSPRNRQ